MSLPKEISDFMAKYGVTADEIWAVRPGTYALKHKALERVAVESKIHFNAERPAFPVTDLPGKHVMCVVWGQMGERIEWATGEAAPYNNKNGYPAAMAEKRAKDRVTLKLLQAHGALYSESEADEFGDPGQGEKGRLLPSSQYARNECDKLMRSMQLCNSLDMLQEWGKAHKEEIRAQPEKFAEAIRAQYSEMADELRAKEVA